MSTKLTDDVLILTVDAYHENDCNQRKTAKVLGLSPTTVMYRLRDAEARGLIPSQKDEANESKIAGLTTNIRELKQRLKLATVEKLTEEKVREKIFNLAKQKPSKIEWLSQPSKVCGSAGIPTLFLSDLHWGEVVNPYEIGGLNSYNLEIASERLKRVVERAIRLIKDQGHPPNKGMVLALGGDMVSGGIHEELAKTDELPPLGCVNDLAGHLSTAIGKLADEFGKIYIPCVTGNHGRTTTKKQYKQRVLTNHDWLLYIMLARDFKSDKRVTFDISQGTDLPYVVENHRYLLTHGDSLGVAGGDGIIGAIGPIMRGSVKIKNQKGSVGEGFDTLIMGHWHQYLSLRGCIVNGSLKGYDEYAAGYRFRPEKAIQGLWWTHPQRGVTIQVPIFAD